MAQRGEAPSDALLGGDSLELGVTGPSGVHLRCAKAWRKAVGGAWLGGAWAFLRVFMTRAKPGSVRVPAGRVPGLVNSAVGRRHGLSSLNLGPRAPAEPKLFSHEGNTPPGGIASDYITYGLQNGVFGILIHLAVVEI